MPGTEHGRETHQGLRGKSHCARAHRTASTQGGASGTYWLLSHTAGGIHYCLSFPAKLFVFTWDPQFSSLNTSVWLFPVAFELLIHPPISTPYVPITGWIAASQKMSWPPGLTTVYSEAWILLLGPTGSILKTGICIYGKG